MLSLRKFLRVSRYIALVWQGLKEEKIHQFCHFRNEERFLAAKDKAYDFYFEIALNDVFGNQT